LTLIKFPVTPENSSFIERRLPPAHRHPLARCNYSRASIFLSCLPSSLRVRFDEQQAEYCLPRCIVFKAALEHLQPIMPRCFSGCKRTPPHYWAQDLHLLRQRACPCKYITFDEARHAADIHVRDSDNFSKSQASADIATGE
jgi:hypothetical protein